MSLTITLKPDWTLAELAKVNGEFDGLPKIPRNGEVTQEYAAKAQLAYIQATMDLSLLVAQAHLYEKQCKFKRDNEYTFAFLQSLGKSDRQREADAKATAAVRVAETKLMEAEAHRKLLEDRRDDAIRAHYAFRSILKDKTEERWLG